MGTTGTIAERRTGWTSAGRAALYWVTATLGAFAAFGSWLLLYLASDEDNRGTAHDRSWPNESVLTLGVVPVLFAHVVGLLLLLMAARTARRDRRSTLWFAVGALVVDSVVGLVGVLLLTGGQLVVPYPQPVQP